MLDILDIEPAKSSSKKPLDENGQRMVCLLVALGEPLEQIARKLEVTRTEVDKVINSPGGIEQVIRFQTAAFPDPLARVKRMAHLALDTQMRLLIRSTSDATVAKVASDILDRSTGKATQVIENRNLNVNITDTASADRALRATEERLERLLAVEQKLLQAGQK